MTVKCQKKAVKEISKNYFDGLKISIQQTNNAMASPSTTGDSKSVSKSKRRRQDAMVAALLPKSR